ncbi:MAG: bifunctional alpha,alpha-trehalose-phosphate synthase (UDP-forming)/trehalose-phosphatase [Clostridia bacterium]|nr:bifunctional alpha,alpha-trehalose-phosphate synthase (UDP-forming)/trehalose-phosphatase [Clostridia bacterium]
MTENVGPESKEAYPAAEVLRQLGGRRLVVVSNREPYSHRRTPAGIVVEKPAGGLVAALDPVLQATGGTWVAWGSGDADRETADALGRVAVPPSAPRYTLRRVWMPPDLVEAYYNGYCNQALWPLMNLAVDKCRFVRRQWAAYEKANRLFAESVAQEAPEDAVIWVQDYHLATCPQYLRAARPDLVIAQFWHVPWPPWDVYRICPQREALLEGLVANDAIGFHLPRYAENFLDAVERGLGLPVDRERGLVHLPDRVVRVESFPISVDFRSLDRRARSAGVEGWMRQWRRRLRLDGKAVALGVDRLDYIKGIPERLRALAVFLERYPEYRGRFVYIQKAAPSRTRVRAYRELRQDVEKRIAELNAAWREGDWTPVVYLPQSLPPDALAALYRLADMIVVSSLQDGMNLVVKEYIAHQVDERGVVLLSELAGAFEEVAHALPVNPYDPEGFAEAIRAAVEMPEAERRRRMSAMRQHLARHDIHDWMAAVFRSVRRAAATKKPAVPLLANLKGLAERLLRPRCGGWLFLDFDGTLAPLVDQPDAVVLPQGTRRHLVGLLRRGWRVAVVSGRPCQRLRQLVAVEGLIYAGDHGLEIQGPGLSFVHPQAEVVREALVRLYPVLEQELEGTGAFLERKRFSATVHYRGLPPPRAEAVRAAVRRALAASLPRGVLRPVPARDAVELRPRLAWDKGRAVAWMLERCGGDPERVPVVYVGDDETDEDAFAVLAGLGVTVRVGTDVPTAADYTVEDPAAVARFLCWLEEPEVA